MVTTLLLSWLLMQVVHEGGHILGAWVTGGKVVHEVLHPLAISRTDVEPNPHPLIVAWAGPLFGSLFPVALWSLAATVKLHEAYLLRFLPDFA